MVRAKRVAKQLRAQPQKSLQFSLFYSHKTPLWDPFRMIMRFMKNIIFRENKEYFPSLSQLAAKKLRNRAMESMKPLQTDWHHENGIWSKQE